MKLNCDLGESFGNWKMGNDEEIMPYIDMANIACGFHASDPFVMAKTVQLAKEHNVSIGAHPGYPDLQGFGRRAMSFSSEEICNLVLYQVGALQSICKANGVQVDYVKPHGALYNTMMVDENVRSGVLKALSLLSDNVSETLPLMVLANSNAGDIKQHALKYSVPVLFEAFADRAYTDEGSLVPRGQLGAVLESDADIEQHVKGLVERQEVVSINKKSISIAADTICVHGDNSHALESVKKIRQLIQSL
jgi:UPF0271 protein